MAKVEVQGRDESCADAKNVVFAEPSRPSFKNHHSRLINVDDGVPYLYVQVDGEND